MPPGRHERAKEIIAEVLACPLEVRSAFLEEACGDDLELRAEVDSLLAHDVDTPSLLDSSTS